MVERRLLTLMVLLGFMLSPFSGSQPFFQASADSNGLATIRPESNIINNGSTDACNEMLWYNGPIVTHPGAGHNGADVSAAQAYLGLWDYGFRNDVARHLAEDFVVNGPEGWQLETLTFFAFQSKFPPYSYPPISTLTGVYLQIWDGVPGASGSSVIFGDLDTNRAVKTYWTGIYRTGDISAPEFLEEERPIMTIEARVDLKLSPGIYWLEWRVAGTAGAPIWTPPISILGQLTTGNGRITFDGGASWQPAKDSNSQTMQGFPFIARGFSGSWLWDQPLSTEQNVAIISQEAPDAPTMSAYLADDFSVQKMWLVRCIFVPGDVLISILNATQLNWMIFTDNNGIPSGDPSGGGSAPIWSLSLPPTDPRVTISDGLSGNPSTTLLSFPDPLMLSPGDYWLVFYPTMTFAAGGQFARPPADTANLYNGQFINPGSGWSFGTNWQDWSVWGPRLQDIAFSIRGDWPIETFLPLITK